MHYPFLKIALAHFARIMFLNEWGKNLMAFSRAQLSSMVALIRANPEMTREQFYAQAGFEESEVQTLTGTLVTLGQVAENHYDQIAPWVRNLNSDQVTFWVDAIYRKYQEAVRSLTQESTNQMLLDAWEKSKRQMAKFNELTNEDGEIQEGLVVAKKYFQAQANAIEMKLRDLGVLEPLPDDLQEVP